ncbi:MAG: ATP-binding protein, partial [Betaproteobacteria bacterium]
DRRPFERPSNDGPPPGTEPPALRPPPMRKVDVLNFQTRVLLLTAEGQYVIGNPAVPRDSPFVAVKSRGQTVGKLLLAPLPELQSEADVAFARSQTRHTMIAAGAVLSFSLLLAWLFARWLLDPIRALSAGSQRLAAGDYRTRIDVKRGDEFGALATDFNRLADALERNQQARRDWGADIAHELRTPLSILRGEIQALQDGVRPVSAEALASLQSECDRLTSLVGDLYQLALSDAGALEYRFVEMDLGAVVMDAADEHRRTLTDAGLTLEIESMPASMKVRGDEQRLSQMLGNLLVNARRYTDSPGTIRIRAAREGNNWILCVEDSPPGVPTNLLPKLFDRLFRVETSRTRAAGGAGLGLAICRNIVEAHGGNIDAGASALGGLAITVSLPAMVKP